MPNNRRNKNSNRIQRHLDELEVLNFDELMLGLLGEMDELRSFIRMRNPEKHFHAIKRYLQCGADPNFIYKGRRLTPFQIAVIDKTPIRFKLAKLFLEYGADPNIPLSNEYDCVSIIEYATIQNPNKRFGYHSSADLSLETELIELIINSGGSVTTVQNINGIYEIYPLFELDYRKAISWGDDARREMKKMINILIKNGAHLLKGYWGILEFIMESTRGVSVEHYDPIDTVLESMDKADVVVLLNSTNEYGWSPLNGAISFEDTTRVLKFLKYGANPAIAHGDKPDAYTYAKYIYKDKLPPELDLGR